MKPRFKLHDLVRHYKTGGFYQILAFALDVTYDEPRDMVVYQRVPDGAKFVRQKLDFEAYVMHEGVKTPRFTVHDSRTP